MLSSLRYQVAPVEQLPLNTQLAATSPQLQHLLKATSPKSTCKTSLPPRVTFRLPAACSAIPSDTPNGAWLIFSRRFLLLCH